MQTELQHAAPEEVAGDSAKIGRSDGLIAKTPRRVIEDVRRVHAEDHLLTLSDLGRLAQCEVHIEDPWGAEHTPLQLSQRSRARLEEDLPVESGRTISRDSAAVAADPRSGRVIRAVWRNAHLEAIEELRIGQTAVGRICS